MRDELPRVFADFTRDADGAWLPRHSKVYMEIFPVIQKVLQDYHDDVVGRRYPGPEHTVFMKEEELKRFRDMVNWHK